MLGKKDWRFIKNQQGLVMPLVLFLMVAGLLIVLPLLFSVSVLANVGRRSELTNDAFYAADAGIQAALWRLENTPSTVLDPVADVNDMQVVVSYASAPYTPSGSTMTVYPIKSVASKDGEVLAEIYMLYQADRWKSPFEEAIISLDGDVTLSTQSDITGDVHANGNVYFDAACSEVSGKVSAYGNISGCTLPNSYPNIGWVNYHTVDFDYYENLAATTVTPAQFIANGGGDNVTVNGNLENIPNKTTLNINGVVWVKGYISAQNNITLKGDGYLISEQYMDFGVNVTTADRLTYMSVNGDITFWCNAKTYNIYAPNGTAYLKNNTNVIGSVVGKEVEVVKSVVTYPGTPPVIEIIITNPTTSICGYSY